MLLDSFPQNDCLPNIKVLVALLETIATRPVYPLLLLQPTAKVVELFRLVSILRAAPKLVPVIE